MTNNYQYSIELLIGYYQDLITMNDRFTAFNKHNTGINTVNSENDRYKNLVIKIIAIRQLIIDKKAADINTLYKPAPGLFINKEHFTTLEAAIQFYKDNLGVDYDIAGAEQYCNDYAATNNDSVNNEIRFNEQTANNIIQALSILGDEIKTQLSEIQEPIKRLVNEDICSQITKSSNDTLAALSTNHELMKSDVRKYDTFLTEHISKSSVHVTEAIEKEHARFVQRMASDSNAIIAGISETVTGEVAIQTNLVKDSMKGLDDKLFKWAGVIFIGAALLLFACSVLSSSWAANKSLNGIRAIAATVQHNNPAPIPKKRHG